ncbi:MAG TPA: chromophore lyase CpcT/CpeT [Flavobacterium sp.]|jgi:hypothetical protein
MKNLLLILVTYVLLLSCNTIKKASYTTKEYLQELVTVMQGTYSSEKQSLEDNSYYNVFLRMVPIWKNKGHYLYVEQAMADNQSKPYRVRIYKISQKNEAFISEIYTLKNEKDWIGKWANPQDFDALSENDIELKPGCEVVLRRTGEKIFEGKTGDKTCPSELRGASYASSKVTITENQILSWDQGFDKNGKQVWGAEKGGYRFDKI